MARQVKITSSTPKERAGAASSEQRAPITSGIETTTMPAGTGAGRFSSPMISPVLTSGGSKPAAPPARR